MKKKNGNKGITLVALVVTIIILLILTGISISQLTGSGLFENARLAEQKSEQAQEQEEGILADYETQIENSRETVIIDKEEYNKLLERIKTLENNSIIGSMVRLTKTDITSTSWTKVELDGNIDEYKLLQFINGSSHNANYLRNMNALTINVDYFKNNYNTIDKYIQVLYYNSSNADRSVYFYYNSDEDAIYAKTAYPEYIPIIFGIK